MKRPEDLSWDRVVERIELDASDGDLVAAEQALRGAENDVVRPELIESVLAQVQAEQAEETTAPLAMPQPRIRALPRMRRFAAAAAAFFFGSKLSAATTVTVMAVVTTMTVIVVRNSTWELTYSRALQILGQSDAPVDAAQSALSAVSNRMQLSIQDLQAIRDDPASTAALLDPIRQGLQEILGGLHAAPVVSLDDIRESARRARNQAALESERVFYIRNTLSLIASGMDAIKNVHHPELQEDCREYSKKLRWLLRY